MSISKTISFSFLFLSFLVISKLSAQDNYWQQEINYQMEIDVDTNKDQYAGKQTIKYTNNSPDTLEKVYFHLYWNAFQPNSAMHHFSENTQGADDVARKLASLKPKNYGYQKINVLKQGNQTLEFEVEETLLVVKLNQPLASGESASFYMEWDSQVPDQIRRSGKDNAEGVELSMTQWYPKMAEYDKEGWQIDHYLSREFHGVWGDFDVKINIDADYVIGSSGKLQNPEGKKGYNQNPNKKGKIQWHFVANKIHDFAWAADPDFIVNTKQVPDGPLLYFVYQDNNAYKKAWKDIQEPTSKFFLYMKNKFGAYPWETYTIVQGGDGGMEYGTCTLVTGNRTFESLYGVVFHEAAHSWFQHLYATDETKYAWFDEGFTSYADALAQQYIFPDDRKALNPAIASYNTYTRLATSGKEEPLTTLADHFSSYQNYGIASYYKGQILASQLEYIVGKQNLDASWGKFYELWQFKHPTPTDFRKVVEKQSDIDLKWYFNLWIGTTKTIDYGIKVVNKQSIILERIGEIPMPLDVLVEFEDGSSTLYYIPLAIMRGQKPNENFYPTANWVQLKDWVWTNPQYTFEVDKKVKKVTLDPSQRLADINTSNNTKNH